MLAIYLRGQGQETEEILAWIAASWVVGRLVALWAIPMEFIARKRRLLLMFQGAIVATTIAIAVASWQVASPMVVVAIAWVLAILSASHRTVLDGLFVSELNERAQIKYALIEPIFWGLGPMAMYGGFVAAVERLREESSAGVAWGTGFATTAGALSLIAFWQWRSLPDPERDDFESEGSLVSKSVAAVREIARKPELCVTAVVALLIGLPASIASSTIFDFVLSMDESTQQSTGDWFGVAALPAFLVQLFGVLWVLRRGLEKVFFRAVVFTNVTIVFALVAALLGQGADRSLLLALLGLANLPFMFASFISGLYVVQQLAPGRFSMSVYAMALVATGLVVRSMRYFTDFLQDKLGYSWLFTFLLLLGVGAIGLAKHAPFEQKYREEAEGE